MRLVILLLLAVGVSQGCSKSKPGASTPSDSLTPASKPEPPVKLAAGRPVGEPGGKVVLVDQAFLRKDAGDKAPAPGGVVSGTVVKSNPFAGMVETRSIRLIPPGQTEWRFEVRPVGKTPLRLHAEKGAVQSLGIENDRGVLFMTTSGSDGKANDPTTVYSEGLKWIDQPYEVFDAKGTKIPNSTP